MALTPEELLELINQVEELGDQVAELAQRADALVTALGSAAVPVPQVDPFAPRGVGRLGEPPTGTP